MGNYILNHLALKQLILCNIHKLTNVDPASGAITMIDSFDGAVLSRISKFINNF